MELENVKVFKVTVKGEDYDVVAMKTCDDDIYNIDVFFLEHGSSIKISLGYEDREQRETLFSSFKSNSYALMLDGLLDGCEEEE